jgi:molecular chaperone GrpE
MTQAAGENIEIVDDAEAASDSEGGEEVEAELGPSADEVIEGLEQESAALKDKWLRALAELENYKKRVKRDIDDATFRVRKSLLMDFLPTVDNLERALELAKDNEELAKGIKMVTGAFIKSLAKHNITQVPGVGHPFDPSFHEALQQIPSDKYAPGVVALVYEKGYQFGDRLLRAARVIVAGPDSTGTEGIEAPASGESDESAN